ncbi:phosphoglycerate mutase family protein [Candidatus Berkelbacteria bacterium]|nr:phosphoglycerate mutase family protein [Candidatus Berkelbacteria bacterium]
MCTACDLILIRHEEATGNVALIRSAAGDNSLFVGEVVERPSCEWPLTATGERRAQELGDWIRSTIDLSAFQFATSPSRRTHQTAQMVLPGKQWATNNLIRGRHWGGIEQVPRMEWMSFCQRHGHDHLPEGFYEAFPGGESMCRVWQRGYVFTRSLPQSTIVVTHGEVMQAVRMLVERIPLQSLAELDRDGNHVRNGQLVWYSRRDPATELCTPHFRFKRICVWGRDSGWQQMPTTY